MNDPFLPAEVRVFVACELPDSWTKALAEASKALSKAGLTYLRWVRPEGIHITLKVPRRRRAPFAAGCRGRDECRGFLNRLRSDCRFAVSERSQGTGDLACSGQESRAIVRRSNASIARLTRSSRIWDSPANCVRSRLHLTLGARTRQSLPEGVASDATAALRSCRLAEVEPLTVRNVALMRSQLGHGGAAYTRLTAASLGNEQDQA